MVAHNVTTMQTAAVVRSVFIKSVKSTDPRNLNRNRSQDDLKECELQSKATKTSINNEEILDVEEQIKPAAPIAPHDVEVLQTERQLITEEVNEKIIESAVSLAKIEPTMAVIKTTD